MLAIFEANAGTFDVFAIIAAVIFVVAAFLAAPDRTAPVPRGAWAATVGYIGLAVFAFGFLFMTP